MDKDKENQGQGRPTKYNDDFHPLLVESLARLGHTDKEMSEKLGIAESTFYEWQLKYPSFSESSKKGKLEIDAKVENALLLRALGYEHPEDKIFCNNGKVVVEPTIKHYPPETAAIAFWLKNRKPEDWRERREVTAKVIHNYDDMSDEDLDEEIISLESETE